MNCKLCTNSMPDLLLDATSPGAIAARAHLNGCPSCHEEFRQLESTFGLLDAWPAPEPSPWFDARLSARLRQQQSAAPEGFFERLRSRLLFSTGRELRPALAGALALVLALGGGTAAGVSHLLHPPAVQASATVQDLQILDRNEQTFQTMDQLLDDPGTQADEPDQATPAS